MDRVAQNYRRVGRIGAERVQNQGSAIALLSVSQHAE